MTGWRRKGVWEEVKKSGIINDMNDMSSKKTQSALESDSAFQQVKNLDMSLYYSNDFEDASPSDSPGEPAERKPKKAPKATRKPAVQTGSSEATERTSGSVQVRISAGLYWRLRLYQVAYMKAEKKTVSMARILELCADASLPSLSKSAWDEFRQMSRE